MSGDKTCDKCIHWKRREAGNDGYCDNVKFVYDTETPDDGLMYWDVESYRAGFRTGEKFGCIHHKEVSP